MCICVISLLRISREFRKNRMNTRNRIGLIMPYFGKLPDYFDFWLRSCADNPSVDFLVFTDNAEAETLICNSGGGNLHYFAFSLAEVKSLAESKLNVEVALGSPYKLCDLKPMYGCIFEDYLHGYDYWGHCDMDLVFGNIRQFVTDDVLAGYDRIFSRGHLSIYRNTPAVNGFFKSGECFDGISSWKEVVAVAHGFSFDEWPGMSKLWKEYANNRMFDEILFDDISVNTKHFQSYQKQVCGSDRGKSHFLFEYDKGNLYRIYWDEADKAVKKEPTLYAHFQKRDMSVETDVADHYLIIPNSFIDYEEPTVEKVMRWGRKRLFYKKYYKIRWNNLKRKIIHK